LAASNCLSVPARPAASESVGFNVSVIRYFLVVWENANQENWDAAKTPRSEVPACLLAQTCHENTRMQKMRNVLSSVL
jgi:hypothetical protein